MRQAMREASASQTNATGSGSKGRLRKEKSEAEKKSPEERENEKRNVLVCAGYAPGMRQGMRRASTLMLSVLEAKGVKKVKLKISDNETSRRKKRKGEAQRAGMRWVCARHAPRYATSLSARCVKPARPKQNLQALGAKGVPETK